MHAILFCRGEVSCIPVNSMPEALLPFCNLPLLAHILQFLERENFASVTLVGADADTKELADSLPLQIQLHFTDIPDRLRTQAPTLVLKRLCFPQWDMGELCSLCGKFPVRLVHADGSPTHALLYPAGSTLQDADAKVRIVLSQFSMPQTPQEYRQVQQKFLGDPRMQNMRIGQNLTLGRQVQISPDTIIGSDCIIGDHAVLESCVIGDGVQIGAGTVLRRCVLCRRALADRSMTLEDAVIGEGEIASAHLPSPRKRRICVDELDGVHEGLPRWNNVETALRTGAALTALGMRIAVGFENENSEVYALAAAVGAASQGAQVWNCGVCALSQLIHAGKSAECDMILHLHGSSVQYLTIRSADGTPLTVAQNRRIRQAVGSCVSTRIANCGKLSDARCLISLWESDCRKILPPPCFMVEVCCGNAILRSAANSLFFGGNRDRLVLNLSDDGTQASVFSTESGMVSHETLLRLVAQCSDGSFVDRSVFTDGILLFVHVLRILHRENCSLANVCKRLPQIFTVKRDVSTRLSRQAVEKLRRGNSNSSVIIALPTASGIVRMTAYADSMETAAEMCGFWEKKLRAIEDGQDDLSQYAE